MIERLGRITHETLGKCVKVAVIVDRQRKIVLFPVNQFRTMHPRHPSGYYPETGKYEACYSPSCSFYSELVKYAQFRWKDENND
jgi:hypothetical protein